MGFGGYKVLHTLPIPIENAPHSVTAVYSRLVPSPSVGLLNQRSKSEVPGIIRLLASNYQPGDRKRKGKVWISCHDTV